MRKTIIFLGIVFLWLLNGCYEDKGNYDYAELNTVTVNLKPANSYTIYGYAGEEVTVVPELTFENPADTLEFDYLWKLDTTVISHERILKYTHQGVCNIFTLQLFVTDRKSGQIYYHSVSLQLDSPYKYGFVILAEKGDGTTALHYLRLEKPEDRYFYYTPFYNLYASLYPEDPLGRKPLYIAENFTTPGNGGDELTILQEEGGCVTLNGTTLNKEVYLEDEFYRGYPDGVSPKLLLYGNVADFVIGDNGKVYMRYLYPKSSQPNGFHLSRFINLPFDFDKPNTYIDPVSYTHLRAHETRYCTAKFRCIFKKGSEYHVQTFTLAKAYSSLRVNLSNKGKWLFEGSGMVSDQAKYTMLRNGNYLYFAEGKSLYYCEFRNEAGNVRQIVKHVHDFDKKITHLTPDYNGDRLLIALEGGKFYIFHTIDQVLGASDPWVAGNIYESPDNVDVGEIKQVIFKYGNFSNSSGTSAPW